MAKDIIDDALEAFDKGNGIQTADKAETKVPGYISSGNLAINFVISGKYLTGGFPLSRLSVINGSESSGKTLLAQLACISCMRKGGRAFYLDTEGTFDQQIYTKLGGDVKTLRYKQYHTLEETWTAMMKLIDTVRAKDKKTPLLFIFDSLADTPSQTEFQALDEGTIKPGDIRMIAAWRASVNSKYLALLSKKVAPNNVTIIITNQLRASMSKYGDQFTMPGGSHLKFAASTVNRSSVHAKVFPPDNENADPIGIHGKFKNTKNKVFIPFKETEYNIIFGEGIDPLSGFPESLARYGKLVRRTIKSNDWIFKKDGKEQVMMLGTKDEMPINFKKFFLENPRQFFDEEDWDENEAKILLSTLNKTTFDAKIGGEISEEEKVETEA